MRAIARRWERYDIARGQRSSDQNRETANYVPLDSFPKPNLFSALGLRRKVSSIAPIIFTAPHAITNGQQTESTGKYALTEDGRIAQGKPAGTHNGIFLRGLLQDKKCHFPPKSSKI